MSSFVEAAPQAARTRPPARDQAVRAEKLCKVYRNPWTLRVTHGLEPLDLAVGRGEVLGLLGPNGAGKTTTLKLLTGLLKPTSGRAWLFDVPIDRPESRRALGFLPEQPYFYDYLNGLEYLELAGRLSGLGGAEARSRGTWWLGRVGLGDRPRLALRKYSKGMLQRLGLAAALVHEPQLLILDEPMSGLDPFGRRDVRELILEQRERGTTVMFSSHILPDVEMVCDRVAIVLDGRLRRTASVSELMNDGRHPIEIRVAGAPLVQFPAAWAAQVERRERPDGTVFVLADRSRQDEVLAYLLARGIGVRAVTPQRSSLEDLFLDVAAHAVEAAGDEAPASPGGERRAAGRGGA